jgi:hypothetical protein
VGGHEGRGDAAGFDTIKTKQDLGERSLSASGVPRGKTGIGFGAGKEDLPRTVSREPVVPRIALYFIYTLMGLSGLVAVYAIFNAGNPQGLLRLVFPDPRSDLLVALASSFLVFVLGFVVFFQRDREGFRRLVALNAEKVRRMRSMGRRDEEIADDILAAMGSHSGYRHNLARKKLLVYLAEFR